MSQYSAQRRFYERSVARLRGILSAISSDNRLDDREIAGLYQWMNENDLIADTPPFAELFLILKESLEDQVVDTDERKDILAWCTDYCSETSVMHCMETEAVRFLHGYLHGLLIDGKLTDKEIFGLRDWLQQFSAFGAIWPFSEAFELVREILEDNRVDESERARLHEFCEGFMEKPLTRSDTRIYDEIYKARFMKTSAPVCQPLESICDNLDCIEFDSRTFCLTGPAKSGKRKDIHDAIRRAGGYPVKTISKALDYLVIGGKSSPAWIYSTYGRKIESVMKNRERGTGTCILLENQLMPVLRQAIRS